MSQAPAQPQHHTEVVVIGAGFGGLGMALRLQRANRSFVVLEAAASLGGTWRDNRYPGVACDVKSHLYGLSMALNPDWSRPYAAGPEIQAYLERVAAEAGLGRHIRFGQRVVGLRWDVSGRRWHVRTQAGLWITARAVVMAHGPLHRPAYPNLPGLSDFQGEVVHTARWPESLDLRGRTVAVVGTGASAVQVIPAIAPQVSGLDVFQRTPAWVLPKDERPYSRLRRWAYRTLPGLARLHRALLYASNELRMLPLRRPKLAGALAGVVRWQIQREVADPHTARALTPSYTLACKRVLLSNDYLPTFNAGHVRLVTSSIQRVTPDGLRTEDGAHHPADVLILATGFVVDPRDYLADLPIEGLNGANLGASWAAGARAYLGTTVTGFPNLFMLGGPNTGIGHTSLVFMLECQMTHVLRCLELADARGVAAVHPSQEALDTFDAWVQRELSRTVWATGCRSWYQQDDGRVFAIWPLPTWRFWWLTRRANAADYRSA